MCYFPDENDANDTLQYIDSTSSLSPTIFAAAPWNPPPPPPPYDPTALILGIFGVLVLAAICCGIAWWLRRKYPAESTRRWDDDYVMMNTNVLTIPLNELPHQESKKKKKDRSIQYDDDDDEDDDKALRKRSEDEEDEELEEMRTRHL